MTTRPGSPARDGVHGRRPERLFERVDLTGAQFRTVELPEPVAESTYRSGHARFELVDGEWSFIETLCHLVLATDAWVRGPCSSTLTVDPLDVAPPRRFAQRDLDALERR